MSNILSNTSKLLTLLSLLFPSQISFVTGPVKLLFSSPPPPPDTTHSSENRDRKTFAEKNAFLSLPRRRSSALALSFSSCVPPPPNVRSAYSASRSISSSLLFSQTHTKGKGQDYNNTTRLSTSVSARLHLPALPFPPIAIFFFLGFDGEGRARLSEMHLTSGCTWYQDTHTHITQCTSIIPLARPPPLSSYSVPLHPLSLLSLLAIPPFVFTFPCSAPLAPKLHRPPTKSSYFLLPLPRQASLPSFVFCSFCSLFSLWDPQRRSF